MASSYSDLLTQLVGEVGDVNPAQVEITFRRCLTSFMEKSQVWRTTFETDLSASTPAPGTRQTLMAAYQAAVTAASADPNNLSLAQAAADARAAAYAPPAWQLTRPIQNQTGPIYFNAIATGMRVSFQCQDATPWWKILPATASGGTQTLEVLGPIMQQPCGRVSARLFWVPTFDSSTVLTCPSWVYERYGGIISDWTIGTLWMRRRGRRSDQAMGQKMSDNAMIDAQRVRARANMEDPIPMSI